ncbi:hypothetical protein [Paenibacillus cremeus]|uniref:hypothetical protein n=1 Tax=Paenibacillus cremeus TaxID=2163881 RepID=UPI001647A3F6|nr:hypothetical protein [Paenibacillus cremeus]
MEALKQVIIEKIEKSKLNILQVVFKERAVNETNQLLLESTANYDPSTQTIYISLKK